MFGISEINKRSLFTSQKKISRRVGGKNPTSYQQYLSTNKDNVQKYIEETLRQAEHHNISTRLSHLRSTIATNGFNTVAQDELENIDQMITTIRLQSEKKLIPAPTPFPSTSVAKRQATIIRLLTTLKRQVETIRDTSVTESKLQNFEVIYTMNPNSITDKISEERQYLRQIQNDIEIHREENIIE